MLRSDEVGCGALSPPCTMRGDRHTQTFVEAVRTCSRREPGGDIEAPPLVPVGTWDSRPPAGPGSPAGRGSTGQLSRRSVVSRSLKRL